MDTPRRGLIRATESAIKEYIKEGCVENLPMIRQLEDVAYQIWVESNTSFLNESVAMEEDDEGWMWDEEYLCQSFSANADDILTDAADDTSSICSSIKLCDETNCSLGYLASCEDSISAHAIMDVPESEDWILSENYFVKDNVLAKVGTDSVVNHSVRNVFDDDQKNNLIVSRQDNRNHDTIENNLSDNHEVENTDVVITEQVNEDEDEWVIVNDDWNKSVPNTDWFIVSVSETAPLRLLNSSTDIHSSKDSVKEGNCVFDPNDWTVLSLEITERTNRSEKQTVKQICRHASRKELTTETLGFETPTSSVYTCPLCKNSSGNYKRAIFCVLMQ